MSENKSNQPTTSDEIDLGQLFKLIGNAFNRIFRGILRTFLYLKRNIFWLIGLFVIGVALALLLRSITGFKQELTVIVTPQLDNTDYLQDVIAEIQANLKAEDTVFFKQMGMDVADLKGFEVELMPLREAKTDAKSTRMMFLEALKEFGDIEAIGDIVRAELMDQTTKDHRITFYFKDPVKGEEYAKKLISYINSNDYYNSLNAIYSENAQNRIQRNDSLIAQVDDLIKGYTQRMAQESVASQGQILLDNQEPLNIPSLFELKNRLIRDTEDKKLELIRRQDAIRVASFGKPHRVIVPVYGKKIVYIPLLLILGFFLLSFIKFLNRKAANLEEMA